MVNDRPASPYAYVVPLLAGTTIKKLIFHLSYNSKVVRIMPNVAERLGSL